MFASLPHTQALASSFRLPPQYRHQPGAAVLTVPELYDWHLDHNPDHTLFLYDDPARDDPPHVRTISMHDAVRAMHKAAFLVSELVADPRGPPDASSGPKPVIAVLAATVCTFVGVLMTGHAIFPVSPRNSPVAIAHLLRKTGVTHLLIGREPAFQSLDLFPTERISEASSDTTSDSGYSSVDIENAQYRRFPIPRLDLDRPAFILHSSGSTAFPKPVTYSHQGLLELSVIPFYGDADLTDLIMGCHSMPLSHGMGMLQIAIAASCGVRMSVFKPASPATIPNPINVWEGTVASNTEVVCCVPAFIEAWARDPQKVEYMKKMKGVMYGGGPLNKEVGDYLAAEGVTVLANYGSTECGVLSRFIPNSLGKDWEYFALSAHTRPHFESYADGVVQLILTASSHETHHPRVVNTQVDSRDAFDTNDLLIRHPDPTKSGLFKVFGRADDQIMLSTGEKTNPGPLESILNQDPHIQAAVMFGRGQFQNGVIVDPRKEYAFDPLDKRLLDDFRSTIWPTVERMNAFAPQHSRLFKEMVLVASPSKPFTYTGKGTPRRPAIIAAYEDEIKALYSSAQASMSAAAPTPNLRTNQDIHSFVRQVVSSVLGQVVEDDADIFQHGCDSLQATWIRGALCRGLRQTSDAYASRVSTTAVFENPSIAKLSSLVYAIFHDLPLGTDPTSARVRAMHEMVQKYSASFPKRPIERPFRRSSVGLSADQFPTGDVVLLTGSTGGLGCNILHHLLGSKKVSRVYALNRKSHSRGSAPSADSLLDRQRAALANQGLDEKLASSPRCILVEADLTAAPGFGIPHELYDEMRCTITHIVHNAWAVNFNLPLSSFEPNVLAMRTLIDIALSSPRPEPPRLIFVSSVGVIRNPDAGDLVPERPVDNAMLAVGAGYSESKYVAEQVLAAAARDTALRPVIVRAGQLSNGPSGYWNEREWFPALVKSSLALRCLPDVQGHVSWVPLAAAAETLVEMRNASQPVLHLAHPRPVTWSALLKPIAEDLAVPIVPYRDWLGRLKAHAVDDHATGDHRTADKTAAHPAVQLLQFFQEAAATPDREPLGVPRLDTSEAVQVSSSLKKLAPLKPQDARLWMKSWRERGFLPASTEAPTGKKRKL
ncbi:acetyl-CoA synthetase-like protein [Punctularia strigosozonata HHB-11173 SS5]|uniref:acetyl-CoA synthetase-like protein n=1 Tax=Punctularia strigosozonata (strain HHB-11173) TaxID=741275 RepID=UPI00044182EA|nr:acetyl-CoA synthetase-like protein [Punctularia strigosozonata HHB-11173 SS5]EIN14664.1 acetyl-CoA synthetase-like protein [Punctularia strigosozonata HHB-11173 SS5]